MFAVEGLLFSVAGYLIGEKYRREEAASKRLSLQGQQLSMFQAELGHLREQTMGQRSKTLVTISRTDCDTFAARTFRLYSHRPFR